MHSDISQLTTAYEHGYVSRRVFLWALGALAVAPRSFAQTAPPIPVTAINHMTISVSDPARSPTRGPPRTRLDLRQSPLTTGQSLSEL